MRHRARRAQARSCIHTIVNVLITSGTVPSQFTLSGDTPKDADGTANWPLLAGMTGIDYALFSSPPMDTFNWITSQASKHVAVSMGLDTKLLHATIVLLGLILLWAFSRWTTLQSLVKPSMKMGATPRTKAEGKEITARIYPNLVPFRGPLACPYTRAVLRAVDAEPAAGQLGRREFGAMCGGAQHDGEFIEHDKEASEKVQVYGSLDGILAPTVSNFFKLPADVGARSRPAIVKLPGARIVASTTDIDRSISLTIDVAENLVLQFRAITGQMQCLAGGLCLQDS